MSKLTLSLAARHRLMAVTPLLLCLISAGCGTRAGAVGGGPPGKRPASKVYVEPVRQDQVTPSVTIVGTITARRSSVVASGADGKVNQFLVREGDIVQEDQDLSILNMVTTDLGIDEAKQVLIERQQELKELENGSRAEEIEEAQARAAAAKVTMDIAARQLERRQRLVVQGAANQDDLDEARERAEAAQRLYDAALAHYRLIQRGSRQEDVAQARARVEAQQAQVDYLIAEKGKRTTHAPFPGVIVAEHTQAGQWLSKNDPVVTIADLFDEVYIIANVDQRDLPLVRVGAVVHVTVDAASKREWTGTVLTIVPRSDWESGSRTFPVKIAVKNESQQTGDRQLPMLTEGMYARVTFSGDPRQALLVHKNAVIRSESGSKVFAVIPGETPEQGTARPVMIQEGGAFGDYIEVTQGELAAGTAVVTEGAERLAPFADLQILTPEAAQPSGDTPDQPEEASPEELPGAPETDAATESASSSRPDGRS
ncbi:MAG: efflux RND transporter periplasmic adaptor subunit [Planctomycetaceae bacterium]|nr:efflux RND transporter periplasmic adaptor subunit [Planctomycetaceae bacterium]